MALAALLNLYLRSKFMRLSRFLKKSAVILIFAIGYNQALNAQNNLNKIHIEISARELSVALNQFSTITSLQLIVEPALIELKKTRAVSGTLQPQVALDLLLEGTDLEGEITDGTIFIYQKPNGENAQKAIQTSEDLQAANSTNAQKLDEVVAIAGFRQSLLNGMEAKKYALPIQDSIFAEDIADFPDLNLAESMQRIPGVYISRDGGEGRQVSVRGLSPDYTRVRINGIEALVTSATTDQRGTVNRSRSFDFNVFTSDLFNQINVYKSRDATLSEGGIAGTIELRTARPFDYSGFTWAASTDAYYSSRTSKTLPRLSFLMSKNWNDRFGLLFSAVSANRDIVEDGVQTLRWQSGRWNLANVSAMVAPETTARLNTTEENRLFYPRTPRYFNFVHAQKRDGMVAALQWYPSNNISIDYDFLGMHLDATRTENFLDAPSFTRTNASGLPEVGIVRLETQGNNIVFAHLQNVDHRLDVRRDQSKTHFTQHTLNANWRVSDSFLIHSTIGANQSKLKNNSLTLQAISENQDLLWDFRQNDRLPLFQWGADLSNPSDWRLDLYRPRLNLVRNAFQSAQVEAIYYPDPWEIKFGLSHFDYRFRARDFGLDVSEGIRGRLVTDLVQALPYGFGANLDMPPAAVDTWLNLDLDLAEPVLNLAQFSGFGNQELNSRLPGLKELTKTAYVQAQWNGELFRRTINAHLGFRAPTTEVSATGFINDSFRLSNKKSYSKLLPSTQINWQLSENSILRLAGNRNFTRPTVGLLNPGGIVSVTSRTIDFGNPNLLPFEALSLDMSYEWYFSDSSYVALSPFFKSVDVFIVTENVLQNFRETGLPAALLGDQTQANVNDIFLVRRPVNGGSADVLGIEFQWQQSFSECDCWLRNMGTFINYAWIKSRAPFSFADGTTRFFKLPGVSNNSGNITVFYESSSFGSRLSLNHRDGYLTAVPGGNDNDSTGVNPASYLDFSAYFALSPAVKLTFEAQNLSNEAEDQFVDSSNRLNSYAKSGRQFLLGLRASF